MPGRPSQGWMNFHSKLTAIVGDNRNASLKRSSLRGAKKYQGPRPGGIPAIEGIRQPGTRAMGTMTIPPKDAGVEDEMTRRRKLLWRARRGDENSLAELRDRMRISTWIHRGKNMILDGVLMTAKGTA